MLALHVGGQDGILRNGGWGDIQSTSRRRSRGPRRQSHWHDTYKGHRQTEKMAHGFLIWPLAGIFIHSCMRSVITQFSLEQVLCPRWPLVKEGGQHVSSLRCGSF